MRFVQGLEQLGRNDVEVAGGKGANLGELIRAGVPVPPGFVLTTAAYREFVTANGIGDRILALAAPPARGDGRGGADTGEERWARIRDLFAAGTMPEAVAGEVLAAHEGLGAGPVAVRSSATAEDLAGASFAGQQETFLNVLGPAPLLAAVQHCWASLWTARALAYRAQRGIDPAGIALAVVVQRLVGADASGVLFTANPATGRRDEVVISAAWGLGESVVSGSVNTDDLVVEKRTGNVRSRATADKTVMTVAAGAGTTEQLVPADRRTQPVLDDEAAATLADLGRRIEGHFGAPQDVEWARADGGFWIVQSRPITALPRAEAAPPTDWRVPDPRAFYVRASIIEQLPDPLSPLFAELAGPSVTRSLHALMGGLSGRQILEPGDVGFPIVNGYAYYRYSRAALWRMTLLTPSFIRLLRATEPTVGPRAWRERAHPRYRQIVDGWAGRPLVDLTVEQLLDGVVELLDAGTKYYTSVQSVIPVAASSELLFTWVYDGLIRRPGDPPAATFLLGFSSAPIRAEQSLYDVAMWTRTQQSLAAVLRAVPSARLAQWLQADQPPPDVAPGLWREWVTRLRSHQDRYGHSVYNLDFVTPVPADDPAPLLDTLRFYLDGDRPDPRERQRRATAVRQTQTAAVVARLDPLRRRLFTRLLGWAQANAPVREDSLADVGLAWPQLRRMLAELGRRLAADGVIDRPDDVYWLRREEIARAGRAGLQEAVEERRALWRGQRRAVPPQILPQGTVWERFGSVMPATSADQSGSVLKGIGASGGQVTAPARVLAGPEDFGRLRPGDVLVASITTPAWTSLFARASAVVTDVGGPLSHGSIVAREYGIPAVLGTAVATRRIPDGSRVRVDGDAGTVTLVDESGERGEALPAARDHARERQRWAVVPLALGGAAALALARKRRHRTPRTDPP